MRISELNHDGDEDKYFGSKVIVNPGSVKKLYPEYTGTILRVLPVSFGGTACEVVPDSNPETSFRHPSENVEVVELVTKEQSVDKVEERKVRLKYKEPSIVECADIVAKKGYSLGASYGQFVKMRYLRPEISNKEWLEVYRKSKALADLK